MVLTIIRILALILLGILTAEILVRRIFFHQIPTQLSGEVIYLLLCINSAVLFWFLWKVVRRVFRTKRERN
jgi:TRAP-type C4-dicarboxylate transport system permease small subunit